MPDRCHILIYTDDPGIYGVAQYNQSMALGLKSAGHRVTIAQAERSHSLVEERRAAGIEHIWLSSDDFGLSLTDTPGGHRVLSEVKPDVVLFSNCCPISNFAAKRAAGEMRLPHVIVELFVAPYLADRFAHVLPELQRHYEASAEVVSVSHENLTLLRQHFRLPASRGRIIYFGRPDSFFEPRNVVERERMRREVGISDSALVVFTAARMELVKGYQYQLRAIDTLRSEEGWGNLNFVWAGGGSLLEQVRAAVRERKLEDRVKVLGERSDVQKWLDASDVFLLPSEAEGMPLAIMEAMAKGLAVAATAVSGIPEELGDAGVLLPAPTGEGRETVAAIVATIRRWAAEPEAHKRLGDACRRRANELFRERRMVDETAELLLRAWQMKEITKSDPLPQAEVTFPPGDYVSPNFRRIKLDYAFPNLAVRDKQTATWPYVRKEVPHNWYVDRRSPDVGFLSRDEAHILYNTALLFRGKRGLEIGAWLGWSACHFAAAGVELDVVDPLLSRPDILATVKSSLQASGVADHVHLYPGSSPGQVTELAERDPRRWNVIFIDGDHDAPAPCKDAAVVEPLAEKDAIVLFHDLTSPDVAQGLDYFRDAGWQTMVYQTMQIVGVAWRGNVKPVEHVPDPNVKWTLPAHLSGYRISGLKTGEAHEIRSYEFDVAPGGHLHNSFALSESLRNYARDKVRATLAPLLAARRSIARGWLATPADQLQSAFEGPLGQAHRSLIDSGMRGDPQQGERTADDADLATMLRRTLSEGPNTKGFLRALLAAQLFFRADELPIAASLEALPTWLWQSFIAYVLMSPEVFTKIGQCDQYRQFFLDWEAELLRHLTGGKPPEHVKQATTEFARRANMIPIYFARDDVKEVHARRGRLLEAALKISGMKLDREVPPRKIGSDTKLRLGILTAHFSPQTETYHTLPYYEHIDRSRLAVTLLSLTPFDNPLAQYCASRADRAIHLTGDFARQAAEIRALDFDLLIFGTNVGAVTNPVALLAQHRLARVQATLFSSPTTTGFRHMDYYISGKLSEGPGAQEHYSEKLIQLDGCGFCFAYASAAAAGLSGSNLDPPKRASFGLPEDAIVFASGANCYKIIPETIDLWASIAEQVPGSRLMLYPFGAAWSNKYPVAAFMNMVYTAFARRGLESERLVVLHPQPDRNAVKQCLKLCDVYLDSLRHAGGHSLVDPLEVGLPSISVEGPFLRSRHGAAMLRSIGMDTMVATDEAEYVKLAVELGRNRALRKQRSQEVTAAMNKTPEFLDSKRFAEAIIPVYLKLLANQRAQ